MSKSIEDTYDDHSFEDILKMVGTTGWKNILLIITIYYVGFVNSIDVFSAGFLGKTPEYHCQNDFLRKTNWTLEQKLNISSPLKSNGKFSSCEMYDLPYDKLHVMSYLKAKSYVEGIAQNLTAIPCHKREFESDLITTVTQWDLVCDRKALYSTTQSAPQIGRLFGSFLLGFMSDKYGRKTTFTLSVIGVIICSFSLSLSSGIWIFIILKAATAMFGMGASLSGFVLQLELILTHQRNYVACLGSILWGFGLFYLAGVAYFVRTWYYLQILLALTTLGNLFGVWILPESPRWLIVNRKFEKSYDILKDIAKSNKKILPEKSHIFKIMNKIYNEHKISSNVAYNGNGIKNCVLSTFDLLVDKRFRKMSIAVFFSWFSVSFVYYGISLGSPSPGTAINFYLYTAFGAATEIVMALIPWFVLSFVGRKKTLSGFFLICALSLFLAMILIILKKNLEYVAIQWSLFIIGRLGIIGSFIVIFLYTAELFPTNHRSQALGQSSTCARIGSIFSAYVNDLLGQTIFWAPSALFGIISTLAGLAILTLPETMHKELPDFASRKQSKIGIDNHAMDTI